MLINMHEALSRRADQGHQGHSGLIILMSMTYLGACHVDYKAIRAVLQERQLKMKLSHDKSHRAKKARPLVVGERCYALGPRDKWLDCFIVGIRDTGRSYDIQVEATGANLTRNRSHIRPRSP